MFDRPSDPFEIEKPAPPRRRSNMSINSNTTTTNRGLMSARQRRRAAAPSKRQKVRAIRSLKAKANRLIAEGLQEKLAVAND